MLCLFLINMKLRNYINLLRDAFIQFGDIDVVIVKENDNGEVKIDEVDLAKVKIGDTFKIAISQKHFSEKMSESFRMRVEN